MAPRSLPHPAPQAQPIPPQPPAQIPPYSPPPQQQQAPQQQPSGIPTPRPIDVAPHRITPTGPAEPTPLSVNQHPPQQYSPPPGPPSEPPSSSPFPTSDPQQQPQLSQQQPTPSPFGGQPAAAPPQQQPFPQQEPASHPTAVVEPLQPAPREQAPDVKRKPYLGLIITLLLLALIAGVVALVLALSGFFTPDEKQAPLPPNSKGGGIIGGGSQDDPRPLEIKAPSLPVSPPTETPTREPAPEPESAPTPAPTPPPAATPELDIPEVRSPTELPPTLPQDAEDEQLDPAPLAGSTIGPEVSAQPDVAVEPEIVDQPEIVDEPEIASQLETPKVAESAAIETTGDTPPASQPDPSLVATINEDTLPPAQALQILDDDDSPRLHSVAEKDIGETSSEDVGMWRRPNQAIRDFFAAQTLRERLPFMAKSTRSAEELENSPLAGSLLQPMEFYPSTVIEKKDEMLNEFVYTVIFPPQNPVDPPRSVIVQVNSRGDSAPVVQADAVLDLCYNELADFLADPTKDPQKFRCIASMRPVIAGRSSPLADNVYFRLFEHDRSAHIGRVYLSKNHPAFRQYSREADYGDIAVCMMTLAWDHDTSDEPIVRVSSFHGFTWES